MPESSTQTREQLLPPDLMKKLDRLDIVSRRVMSGKLKGERRGKKRGSSVEFADYRPYVAGDDLRHIDWNLYARLDRLFLRLFLEEEDLSVSLLLDVSASMDWGAPNKLLYAKRLAAALGYAGLVHYNRVHFYSITDRIEDQLPNLRGRHPVGRMIDFLDKQPAGGAGDLAGACKRFTRARRDRGIVILISDLLDKGDLRAALRLLTGDRYEVYVVQVLSPQEVDPEKAELAGDLRLVDCEDAARSEVSITPTLIKHYRARVQAYCEQARAECLRRGMAYIMSETSVPLETLVLTYFRERGMLG